MKIIFEKYTKIRKGVEVREVLRINLFSNHFFFLKK